jgi:hypothetical protein
VLPSVCRLPVYQGSAHFLSLSRLASVGAGCRHLSRLVALSDPAQTLLSLHSRSLYWITSGVEEQTSDSSASIPQQHQTQHRSYLFSQSISHKCRKRRHHINQLLPLIRSYNKLALSYTAVWQHSGYEVDTKRRLGAGWGKVYEDKENRHDRSEIIPKSLFPSTPSPELSPRCSSALSHWDADDEATMSAEELVSSQPSSVAIPQNSLMARIVPEDRR